MQGNEAGITKGYRTFGTETDTVRVYCAMEPLESASGRNSSPNILGACAAAVSGAIAGFFLSGAFSLAGIAFVSVSAGAILGWMARGLSR
ncbi:hypothetical protein [Rhizobium sp. C4]|uniref:hypothetical protein n=1 Tax=Rhizobium sp. C4 TaxID=1349800 RepID=UPI001E4B19F2|nr:hypothetical protein [Rhizobium sp. C4]MCD2172305.1 hypothetical protein [Rhizobium sp. C4]